MQFWGDKLDFQKELFESLKMLRCDIVVCAHEQAEREDEGTLSGKVLPLVQGSFRDQIGTHFTDLFRQHAVSKPDINKLTETDLTKTLVNFQMSKDEYIKFVNSFDTNTVYLWQLQPDSLVNCKTHLVKAPKFTRANWNIFK